MHGTNIKLSILILSSHQCLGLPSDFPTKILRAPLLSPIRATCSAHLIIDLITEWYLVRTTEIYVPHYVVLFTPVISSLLDPNIPINTLFSHTLSLMFLSQCGWPNFIPTKTSKIIVPCILIFIFLGSKLEDKRFCTEWEQAFPDFKLLLISPWIELWFVRVVPKYSNYSTISKELLSIFMSRIRPAFWSRDMTMYLVLSAFILVRSPY
jgi:hypothetical protein